MIIGGRAERLLRMLNRQKKPVLLPRIPVETFIANISRDYSKLGIVFNPFDVESVLTAAIIKRRLEYTIKDLDSADYPLYVPDIVMIDAIHNFDTNCEAYLWVGVKPNTDTKNKKALIYKTLTAKHYFTDGKHELTAFNRAHVPDLSIWSDNDRSDNYSLMQLFGLHTDAFGAMSAEINSGLNYPVQGLIDRMSVFTDPRKPIPQEDAVVMYETLAGALSSLSTSCGFTIQQPKSRNISSFPHVTKDHINTEFSRYCKATMIKAGRLFNRQYVVDSSGVKHEIIFFSETGFDAFFLTRYALSIAPYYCNLVYGMNGHVYSTNYPNIKELQLKEEPIAANHL